MIKFDKNEFLKPQIYSTLDEYETRCNVTEEIIKEIEQLQQENKQLKDELKYTIGIVEHNKIISEKNKEIHQLKDELKSKPDVQITLQDDKGNKFMVIQTERIDMQVELNKTIEKLFNNWNKLKKYINEANEDLYWTNNYDDILYIMQELEGSDSNVKD